MRGVAGYISKAQPTRTLNGQGLREHGCGHKFNLDQGSLGRARWLFKELIQQGN